MKNRIFVDLKSGKIALLSSNLQLSLLLASLTHNTHLKFKGELLKIGFLVTSNLSKSKIAVLKSNLQVRLLAA